VAEKQCPPWSPQGDNYRKQAVEVLRRFVRGEAGSEELDLLVKELDLSGVEQLCETLSLSATEFLKMDLDLRDLAHQLQLYLAGRLPLKWIYRWLTGLQSIVTSRCYESSTVSCPAIATTLGLLSLLLDPDYPAPPQKLKQSLARIHGWLRANKPVPARTFLRRIFCDMGAVRLCVLENPLAFSADLKRQWVDVGLRSFRVRNFRGLREDRFGEAGSPRGRVRLIPLSIFTRGFFQGELQELLSRFESAVPGDWSRESISQGGWDSFCYHPENNQAISLKERFPYLRRCPIDFRYYVDPSGLAEIVLDTPAIHRRQILFAVKLFCLQNGVRRAILDGRTVSGKALWPQR